MTSHLTMMNLVTASLDGILEGAREYNRWTGGYNITDYGTEHVMNVFIAKSIMEFGFSSKTYLVMEETFSGIRGFSHARRKRGPKPIGMRASGRVDIAVFSGDELFTVMEIKRSARMTGVYSDIERLKHYIDYFDGNRDGIMEFGVFCSLEFMDSKKQSDINSWAQSRINAIQNRVKKIDIRLIYRSMDMKMMHKSKEKYPVALAFIVTKAQ